jgi:hypothetical protein
MEQLKDGELNVPSKAIDVLNNAVQESWVNNEPSTHIWMQPKYSQAQF